MVRQRKRGIKGAGSVYQRKSDGRWTGSFVVEETGKRKYVYAPVDNNTQKAAYDLLQEALQQQKRGTLATGKDQKLEDYLVHWFEEVHKPTIYITSYVRYCVCVYKHIIPSLGHIELRKLKPQHIQQFYADKTKEGQSPSSIEKMHSVLHRALDNAVKWKLVTENVSDTVTLPKVYEREWPVLTKEQIIKLVSVADTHSMGAFIKLALMSGMRHSEMLALKWQAIDFETGILTVKYSVARLPGYGFVEGEPKTDDSARKITLPQFVLNALKEHGERQQQLKQMLGSEWKDKDLVFCTGTGNYLQLGHNLVCFRRVLKEVGLPETMRVHDLRHNVATFLINVLKYPPNFVQAMLGHSDIAITLRLYTGEVDPETMRGMTDELNDLFGGD
jgi:integrase